MQHGLISGGAVLLALLLFLAVNLLVGTAIGPARVDFTEDRLFTLSEGTKSILAKLDEPIRAEVYYTEEVGRDLSPVLHAFATRVKETLEEFGHESDGKLEVEFIDPEPFSEAEDDATSAGVSGIAAQSGQVLYLGLVLTNSVGGREVMPFLDESEESFLEYELARRIYTLSQSERPSIGLMTSLPINGGEFDPIQRRPPDPPWVTFQQLGALFELRELATDATEIPDDIAALLLVHPKGLSEATIYAIDQYVLSGRPAVVFVDPQCLADMPPTDPNDPMSQYMQTPGSSDLLELFRAWGLRLAPGVVAADRKHALEKQGYERGVQVSEEYVVWMSLGGEECLAEDEAAVGRLTQLWMAQAGELEAVAGATTTFTPLVQTSAEGARITASKVTLITQADDLLKDYLATGTPLTVAARVEGPASTAFPSGRPKLAAEGNEGEAEQAENEAEPAEGAGEGDPGAEHLSASTTDIRVVAVADADMLSDFLSYRERRLGPISLGPQKLSDNGDFLLNVVQQLAGSQDLISIRGRGRAYRPMEVKDEISQEAEAKFHEKELELQRELEQTDQRLRELQSQSDDASGLLQQQAEIDRFLEAKVRIRRELRELLHDKDRDTKWLGTCIKFLNVLLMPALVLGAGLLFWLVRVSHRKQA